MFLSFHDSQKQIAIIIFFIMATLFIYQILNFFRQNTKNNTEPPALSTPKQVKITPQSMLFTKSLFGDYVPIVNDADIKESTLDVEIVGIVFSKDEEDSQVLIKDAAGDEKTYIIGDTLPGGAVIKRINERGVVVLYNGSLESLSLPKNDLLFEKPAKPLIREE